MSTTIAELLIEQKRLADEIFKHKSDINNITLQLDREDPDDDSRKEWRVRTTYARSMKEAELEHLENMLEGNKSAIKSMNKVKVANSAESSLLAQEFMEAAERRLNPEVFDSIKMEAQEIVQDKLYDAAHATYGN